MFFLHLHFCGPSGCTVASQLLWFYWAEHFSRVMDLPSPSSTGPCPVILYIYILQLECELVSRHAQKHGFLLLLHINTCKKSTFLVSAQNDRQRVTDIEALSDSFLEKISLMDEQPCQTSEIDVSYTGYIVHFCRVSETICGLLECRECTDYSLVKLSFFFLNRGLKFSCSEVVICHTPWSQRAVFKTPPLPG